MSSVSRDLTACLRDPIDPITSLNLGEEEIGRGVEREWGGRERALMIGEGWKY